MSSIDEIRDAKIKKLKLFKNKGINPYKAESKRELSLKEVIDSFDTLEKPARRGGRYLLSSISPHKYFSKIYAQVAVVFLMHDQVVIARVRSNQADLQ